MTTKCVRITAVLATAAALAATAVPASASASERQANYGKCVSLEAKSGASVREFTEFFSPATVVGDMVNLPPGATGLPIACGTGEG